MTKNTLQGFLSLLFLLLAQHSIAQKIKAPSYKDIFSLLSTKQYEQAEPFLKLYLTENDDNPNAFLYMGIIFQEKSAKMDVLKQTREAMYYGDSAVLYFDKALSTIDEKHVRKRDEWYQAYNRRDLRTGEFGVNLSDIQFDLQKRKQSLKERNDKLKMLKHYFVLSDSLYRKTNRLYRKMQDEYGVERQMLLRSDDNTIKQLVALSVRFDSCMKAFENYKTSSSFLGKTGYNQTITLKPIADFVADGRDGADFYQDNLALWDYKQYADKTRQVIEKDIFPMRAHLVTYDIEINKLREKLQSDSVSVRNDLTKLIDVLLYEKLQKFDPTPLPMEIFSMKTADLEYKSIVIENKPNKDSVNVHFQIAMLGKEMRALDKLDSISARLAQSDIDKRAKDYAYFIANTYGNAIVVNSYVKSLHDFALRQKNKTTEQLNSFNEALNWIVDGADSIPVTDVAVNARNRQLSTVAEAYTVGLTLKDSVQSNGYFYTVVPSRKPVLKVLFPVDAVFKEKNIPTTKALTFADPQGQLYYVLLYSDKPKADASYAATLAKIYKSDGLAWSNNIALTFIPTEMIFKAETNDLVLRDGIHQVTVDKNGKLLK